MSTATKRVVIQVVLVLLTLILFVSLFFIGLYMGFVYFGKGHSSDVFALETWHHITDFIK